NSILYQGLLPTSNTQRKYAALPRPCLPPRNGNRRRPWKGGQNRYFTSTVAPASVNFFLIASASSLLTPSLTGFGAPSTRSFASFSPRLVTSRQALITLTLFAPAAVRTPVNSVFSSAAGAAAAPAAAPAAITGAAAAAETPNFSSSILTSWDASSSVKP